MRSVASTAEALAPPAKTSIAQAARVEALSARSKVAWMLCAAATHFLWGTYSVATRWLQMHAHAPTIGVAALLPTLCWAPTAAFCVGPELAARCRPRGAASRTRSADGDAAASGDEEQQAAAKPPPSPPTTPNPTPLPPPPPCRAALARWLRLQLLALAVGAIVALAALGLVAATLFAPAFLVQLVMVLTPLFTALASRAALRQPTPYLLWPALAAGVGGTALVVVGGSLERRGGAGSGGSGSDGGSGGGSGSGGGNNSTPGVGAADALPPAASLAAGLGISLAAALLFSAYFIALQATRRLLTTRQQVMASRNAAVLLTLPLALALDGPRWPWLEALSPGGWGALLFASLAAFNFGSVGLQFSTRALGAATVAQLSCLRVVAAIAGSAALLGEVPRHPATIAGLAVVVGSTAGWLWLTGRHAAAQQQKAAAAAAAAAAQAGSGGEEEEGEEGAAASAAAAVAAATAAAEEAPGKVPAGTPKAAASKSGPDIEMAMAS